MPVIGYAIMAGHYTFGFWLSVAAGLSDGVDGYLAKRLNQTTILGAYLDPIADKVLLIGLCIVLGQTGHIPTWLVMMILFRDLVIVGGVMLLHAGDRTVQMKPLLISKVNTVAQLVLVSVVMARLGIGLSSGAIEPWLVYYAGLTTFASGTAYVGEWSRQATWFMDRSR
jgi:cardiolipin synthase